MIFRYLPAILIFLTFCSTSAVGQNSDRVPDVWIGMQANALTSFRVNSITQEGSQAQGVILSLADLDRYNFGIEFHIYRGFSSAVDFLYGGGLFYALIHSDQMILKSGLNISKFAVNDYKREYEVVGGKIEDQFPETFKPYLTFEWPVKKSFLLSAQAGYRFLRSDVQTVTEIVEQYPNGSPSRINVSRDQKWYGSGFEFGLGLKVKVF